MGKRKAATDLLDNPIVDECEAFTPQPTPFDKGFDILSETAGERLELMTRTDSRIIDACQLGYTVVARFGSAYVGNRVNQLMRLAISKNGRGREEIVESIKAGAGVPDTFYEGNSGYGYD